MRKFIFNTHLFIALLAGGFIVILGITGSIMAFEPELDHLFHSKRSYVIPGASARSLEEIGALASRVVPGQKITAYRTSTSPDISWQVLFERNVAYVNQYTGEVLGVYGDGPEFLDYVHQLHLRLLWQGRDSPGEKIIAWSGVAMLLLITSGLYLWWPMKRFSFSAGATGRRWWLDFHNVCGIFSLVFLLLLSVTGVVIGFDDVTTKFFYTVTGSHPSQMPAVPKPASGTSRISPDQAMAIARTALPGATPFLILMPGRDDAFQVRLRYPEDRTPGGRSRALIDQYSGKLLFVEGSRSAPAGSRMVNLNRAIHTGDIFGIPSKFLMSLASLMAAVQLLSGIVMWRKRAKLRQSAIAATARR